MSSGKTIVVADPKEIISLNLKLLRAHAEQLFIQEDPVPPETSGQYLIELFALGNEFQLTERDLTVLLLKGILGQTVKHGV